MNHERKFVLAMRLSSLSICILLFIIMFIIPFINKIEIISFDGAYTYYESLNESICEISFVTNKDASLDSSSKFRVKFYDKDDNFLGIFESNYLFDDGNVHSCTFYEIPGSADYYEILDYEIYVDNEIPQLICLFFALIVLVVFICTLELNYKRYLIAGNEVIVYAGFYNHYIKINGYMADEYKTLITFTPIYLSCAMDEQNMLQARITLSNRISLQCNNMLVKPFK